MHFRPNRIKQFELICIRSVHTLVTKGEFDCKLRKLDCVVVW